MYELESVSSSLYEEKVIVNRLRERYQCKHITSTRFGWVLFSTQLMLLWVILEDALE
jgi:hypothetical protein